jgi:hypothetical protein
MRKADMTRVLVRMEIIEDGGKVKTVDSWFHDLPMSVEETAQVGAEVTEYLERMSARDAAGIPPFAPGGH